MNEVPASVGQVVKGLEKTPSTPVSPLVCEAKSEDACEAKVSFDSLSAVLVAVGQAAEEHVGGFVSELDPDHVENKASLKPTSPEAKPSAYVPGTKIRLSA